MSRTAGAKGRSRAAGRGQLLSGQRSRQPPGGAARPTSSSKISAASALPTATISRQVTLAASSGGFATIPAAATGVVGERRIFLDQGTYTWGYTISKTGFEDANARNIFLDQGTYDWHCNINGTLAAYPAVNYVTFCELVPERAGLEPAFLPASGLADSLRLPAGVWDWTSLLTPIDVPG
jgi:hypothetical protein